MPYNKQYSKKYYENNKEKIQEITKKFRENNPEKRKKYDKKYRENNPEKIKNYKKKYYRGNMNSFFLIKYQGMKARAKKRKMNPPTFTKTELISWVLNQPNFNQLWKNWEESNYNTLLSPSINRLDNSKSYSFDNIELITWGENYKKGSEYIKKPVIQLSLNNEYINTFDSAIDVNFINSVTNICRCCNGKQKTSGGYKWMFKKDYIKKQKNGEIK